MPVYEYRCRTCDTRFEARRPMSDAAAPIHCPDGHGDTTRLLSVFASIGASGPGAASPAMATAGDRPGGGGCGPGCACMS